jgi:hypothetical protein
MPVDSSAVLIVMLPAAKDVLQDARAVKIAAARLAVLRVLMDVIINALSIAAVLAAAEVAAIIAAGRAELIVPEAVPDVIHSVIHLAVQDVLLPVHILAEAIAAKDADRRIVHAAVGL